ncbi:ribonucleoside-triphosphate reductase [Micromonospora sp. A200]|uniref:ribonucleoside-triphosphate reductase, adenosylcobalamin-dependent n=1 Tax=Micromonospora sp. A200 TaxID=2940568 RepID=UPI0024733BC5|nr:ribonucleoside-triphosphate reductase, adenosylcobalamin-dependent [Micromonospora sp. A200]MDH6462025.1 ribonucleoside-triphosphate reductase [Micromonospora sp. A200]
MITIDTDPGYQFGPTGEVVYNRTYSRTKPDGTKETWPETVERVVEGNLGLVYGAKETWSEDVQEEYRRLKRYMLKFAIIPAGRHLWASGVKGRQYLFNCHVAGWTGGLSKHFEFTFMRLMEGGGVGANYSTRFLEPFGAPRRRLKVHVVCDPMHRDYEDMKAAGLLSEQYASDWAGAFEVEDSREGWAAALVDLIDTYMTDDEVLHENRVYDVSRVRCKGSRLKTFGGYASGPAPFAKLLHEVERVLNDAYFDTDWSVNHVTPVQAMEIDHAIAECVVSGGNRRSARMSIVHWKDPFIADFLECKQDTGLHWTTNISVEVDEEFLTALADQRHINHVLAAEVHRQAVTGMLTNGEPGYWHSTLTNEGEVNEIVATNPCGEIGLPEWGACVLGHVNLDAFSPTRRGGPMEILGLLEAHRLMARFLIRATYGDMNDAGQKAVMDSERRVGVGHFGVQAFFAKRGVAYAKLGRDRGARKLLTELYSEVRQAARDYAFELRIPEPVKVTTVAPTGTVAKMPGVTEGIHPIYAKYFIRRVRFSMTNPEERAKVEEFRQQGFEVEPCIYDQSGNTMVVAFPTKDNLLAEVEALGYDQYEAAELVQSVDEIALDDLLSVQSLYQQAYADNAVSFTANVRPGLDVAETAKVIAKWLPTLKGTTVMVDGTRPQAPYERISAARYDAEQAVLVSDGIDEDCATGACPVR